MRMYFRLLAIVCVSTLVAGTTFAQVDPDGSVIVDFTEDFENGAANFADADRNVAQLQSTGGLANSAFIRATTNPDFQGVVFRAEIDARAPGAASGGAFAGDYLTSQVESVSFYLRHDAAADATFSVRLATGVNFPAINTGLGSIPASSEFTKLTIDFTDPSNFTTEGFGGVTFESVASGIGNIQITASSDDTAPFNVDIDNFSISTEASVTLGDVSGDGVVDFLDISPFIAVLSAGTFHDEADIDRNNTVDFLDIAPFIAILSGQ